jgi:hypothetical protein
MKNLSLIVLLLILPYGAAKAQSITLNTKSFYGTWNNESNGYFYGGGGLALQYEQPIKKGALRLGFEFRSINWGNQLALNTGYNMVYIQKAKWTFNGISSLGVGLALFKHNPLFIWSAMYMPEFSWQLKEKFHLNIGIGINFTNCPIYKNYGSINQVLEIPVKIGFQFKLGGNES